MALNFKDSKNASKALQMQQRMAEESNSMISKMIPVDSIVENEDNESIYRMNNIDSLATSIEEDGFTDPIGVYDLKNSKYEIFTGHRRFRAMKLLGENMISCIVFPMPKDDIERAKRLIKSNSLNRDYDVLTKARELKYYFENVIIPENKPGNKRAQLAKEFNISETLAYKYLTLLDLIPDLQELANDENLPFSAFSAASKLPEEAQETLYFKVLSTQKEDGTYNTNRQEITRWIKNLSNGLIPEAPIEEPEEVIEEKSNEPSFSSENNNFSSPSFSVEEKSDIQEDDTSAEHPSTFYHEAEGNQTLDEYLAKMTERRVHSEEKSSDQVQEISEHNSSHHDKVEKERFSETRKNAFAGDDISGITLSSQFMQNPQEIEGPELSMSDVQGPSNEKKTDLNIFLRLQFENLKKVKTSHYTITNTDNLKILISNFKELLSEIEKAI